MKLWAVEMIETREQRVTYIVDAANADEAVNKAAEGDTEEEIPRSAKGAVTARDIFERPSRYEKPPKKGTAAAPPWSAKEALREDGAFKGVNLFVHGLDVEVFRAETDGRLVVDVATHELSGDDVASPHDTPRMRVYVNEGRVYDFDDGIGINEERVNEPLPAEEAKAQAIAARVFVHGHAGPGRAPSTYCPECIPLEVALHLGDPDCETWEEGSHGWIKAPICSVCKLSLPVIVDGAEDPGEDG